MESMTVQFVISVVLFKFVINDCDAQLSTEIGKSNVVLNHNDIVLSYASYADTENCGVVNCAVVILF